MRAIGTHTFSIHARHQISVPAADTVSFRRRQSGLQPIILVVISKPALAPSRALIVGRMIMAVSCCAFADIIYLPRSHDEFGLKRAMAKRQRRPKSRRATSKYWDHSGDEINTARRNDGSKTVAEENSESGDDSTLHRRKAHCVTVTASCCYMAVGTAPNSQQIAKLCRSAGLVRR